MTVQDEKRLFSLIELRESTELSFEKIGKLFGISGARAHQLYHAGTDRLICDHHALVAYKYTFPGRRWIGYKVTCRTCQKCVGWKTIKIIELLGIPIIEEER